MSLLCGEDRGRDLRRSRGAGADPDIAEGGPREGGRVDGHRAHAGDDALVFEGLLVVAVELAVALPDDADRARGRGCDHDPQRPQVLPETFLRRDKAPLKAFFHIAICMRRIHSWTAPAARSRARCLFASPPWAAIALRTDPPPRRWRIPTPAAATPASGPQPGHAHKCASSVILRRSRRSSVTALPAGTTPGHTASIAASRIPNFGILPETVIGVDLRSGTRVFGLAPRSGEE